MSQSAICRYPVRMSAALFRIEISSFFGLPINFLVFPFSNFISKFLFVAKNICCFSQAAREHLEDNQHADVEVSAAPLYRPLR
jgi:hypothetical protein